MGDELDGFAGDLAELREPRLGHAVRLGDDDAVEVRCALGEGGDR